MLEKINESIEIMVKFGENKVEPAVFKWRGKVYRVEKINMVHKEKQGGDTIYYFSVSDNINFFRLSFLTRDLGWRIEEIYWEG